MGTIEPRKNLVTLMEAFKALRRSLSQKPGFSVKLVIAGQPGWLTKDTFRAVTRLGLGDDVIFTGYVEDEDLPALYSAASALAMPSRYEGFGLPVVEAMACGTPVVCSDAASLPEVAGDAALLAPPDDVGRWVEALHRVVTDEGLRATLREKGLKRAASFTWERAAQQTSRIYSQLVADGKI